MRSYLIKENHIGSAVGKIQTDRKTSCYFIIMILPGRVGWNSKLNELILVYIDIQEGVGI